MKRRILILLGIPLVTVVLACLAAAGMLSLESGRNFIAGQIERLASNDEMSLEIGRVRGSLLSSFSIDSIELRDGSGEWLEIINASVDWSPFQVIFGGRLQILEADIERLTLSRLPQSSESSTGSMELALPVVLFIEKFSIGEINLPESVIGTDASFSMKGNALVPSLNDRITLGITASRLGDVEGSLQFQGSFNPSNDQLELDLDLSEDAGGVVSTFLNLREEPPLKFTVKGSGALGDWSGNVRLQTDIATAVEGTVNTGLVDDGLVINASLDGNLEHLAPPEYSELLSGDLGLDLEARIGADGATSISSFAFSTDKLDANGTGEFDSSGIPGSISVEIAANSQFSPVLSLLGVEELGFSAGNASLDFQREDDGHPWSLTGDLVDADWYGNAFGSVSLKASGELVESAAGGYTELPFEAELGIDSLGMADETVQQILGESLNLKVDGKHSMDGSVRIDSGLLNNWLGTFDFSLDFAGSELSVDAETRNANLANLSEFFDLEIGGEADIVASTKVNFSQGKWFLDLDSQTTDGSLGFELIDRLIAGPGELGGEVSGNFDFDRFDFARFKLAASNIELSSTGILTDDGLEIDLESDLKNLAALEPGIEGALTISGSVEGAWDSPDLDLELNSNRIKLIDIPFENLTGKLDLTADSTDPRGVLSLNGLHSDIPIESRAVLEGYENGGYSIRDIQITGANLMADGHAMLTDNGLAEGEFNLTSPDLKELGGLFATELGGSMNAELNLSIDGNRQTASVNGNASEFNAPGIEAGSVQFEASVSDIADAATSAGSITAANTKLNGHPVEILKATFEPKGKKSAFALSASAYDTEFDLKGSADWQQEAIQISLESSDISHGSMSLSLSEPVDVSIQNGVLEFGTSKWQGRDAKVSVRGKSDGKVHFDVEELPLNTVRIFAPDLELEGVASGEAILDLSKEDFHMTWDATISNASAPVFRQNGLGQFSASGNGEIIDGKAGFDVRVTNDREFFLDAEGDVELDSLVLNCKLKGEIPLQTADLVPILLSQGISMEGMLLVDLSVKGVATSPEFLGMLQIRDGVFNDPANGIRVTNLNAEAEFDGSKLVMPNISGKLNESGDIAGEGHIEIDPENSFPSRLSITIKDSEYVRDQLLSMTFNSELLIEGPLLTGPAITGTLDISRMEIQIPERLPGGFSDIDITHVDAPEQVVIQTRKVRGEAEPRDQMSTPFNAYLKIDITAPESGFFVRGRGMLAEMGGQLRIEGTNSDVEADGSFSMIRGRLYIFGKNLTFQRGIVTFTGNFNPELDFISETEAADATIIVSVKGVASDPEFSFSSEPELPQDEILALLLFNRRLDQLSSIQIASLAAQIASLTSSLPVGLDTVRSSLGVDVLDFRTDKEGNAVVEVGKYINDNVYFGVTDTEEASSVAVDIDITKTLKGRGELDDMGESRVGIDFSYDY